MRRLQDTIWSRFLGEPPEPPTPPVQRAFHCHRFLGGWFPERLGLYFEIYGAAAAEVDVDLLLHLLIVIRDELRS